MGRLLSCVPIVALREATWSQPLEWRGHLTEAYYRVFREQPGQWVLIQCMNVKDALNKLDKANSQKIATLLGIPLQQKIVTFSKQDLLYLAKWLTKS